MQNDVKSILIVGVGGQGTLLASKILGTAMMNEGYDVKVSEVHGMSQRGGSVITYVRYGTKVASPIIEEAQADIILAFEQLEAARYLPYLKKGGFLITNTQKMDPMPVITGTMEYPQDIIEKIREKGVNLDTVDALDFAVKAGSQKAVNVVLMGAMAAKLNLPKEAWVKALEQTVPQKFIEMNKTAFELGFNNV